MPFPCFHQRQGRDIALAALPSSIVRELAEVCREAWHGGMLAGCNGNASCRWQSPEGERIVITRSGAAKGRLTLQDLCVLDARSGATLYGGPSSSEGLMHLEVYAARPRCGAILHTHPRQLLALALNGQMLVRVAKGPRPQGRSILRHVRRNGVDASLRQHHL